MTTTFDGRSVIITGAGKGIGRACAIDLAKRGARIVAIARTQSDLVSLNELTGCVSIIADLADSTAARAAMQ